MYYLIKISYLILQWVSVKIYKHLLVETCTMEFSVSLPMYERSPLSQRRQFNGAK